MSTFVRGITETISSLFRGIFLERNSVANPTLNGADAGNFVEKIKTDKKCKQSTEFEIIGKMFSPLNRKIYVEVGCFLCSLFSA